MIFAAISPIGMFVLLMNDFGADTVVSSVESPNGKYRADVIDSSQGALGGNTYVDVVYEDKGIDAFAFKIYKKPKRVYSGDWGEFINMKIYWEDDNRLFINSFEYKIK